MDLALKILIFIFPFLISIGVFVYLMILKKRGIIDNIQNRTNVSLEAAYTNKKDISAEEIRLFQMGIKYRFKNYNLTPYQYQTYRIATGIVTGVITYALSYNLLGLIIGFVLGYKGLDFILVRKNQDDNSAILDDIYQTYVILSTQCDAEVYIITALDKVYAIVKNERYKQAIGRLITSFARKDISFNESLTQFKNMFNSMDINKLASFLGSILKYGYNKDYLNDMMAESTGILQNLSKEREKKVENKASLIIFGVFVLVIAIIVYLVYTQFFSSIVL